MELLELGHGLGQADQAVVGDRARGNGQGSERLGEAVRRGHVLEAGVGNVTTKRDVYTCQLFIFGQESDANVTDVITSTEVDGLQVGHIGQGFEAGVCDTDTET